MADIVVVDCSARATTRRSYTAAESNQAVADAVVGEQIKAASDATVTRSVDADDALTALIQQAGGPAAVRSKLKAVLAGTDTLTNTQAQRLRAFRALVVAGRVAVDRRHPVDRPGDRESTRRTSARGAAR